MLDYAYQAGIHQAEEDFLTKLSSEEGLEKTAYAAALGSIGRALMSGGRAAFSAGIKSRPVQAGKFMLGMGGKTRLGKAVSFWGASPLTFGGINAAMAEEGQRGEAFAKGVLGGLLFNVGMRGGEKLVGAGMRKALAPKGASKGITAFTRNTRASNKATADALKAQGKKPGTLPEVGSYVVPFKQLGGADKLRRGTAAVATGVAGFGGGMALSSLGDPMYDSLRGNQTPYKAHPMTHVNNPYNPIYYR